MSATSVSHENFHVSQSNYHSVSLEKIVRSKLETLFTRQKEEQIELNGLYVIIMEQVEKPLIEMALKVHNGNQLKTALMLGISRNTLKKKILTYKIKIKKSTNRKEYKE